jgi:hypothetical protein
LNRKIVVLIQPVTQMARRGLVSLRVTPVGRTAESLVRQAWIAPARTLHDADLRAALRPHGRPRLVALSHRAIRRGRSALCWSGT